MNNADHSEPPIDVDDRIRELVEEARRRREREAQDRAAFAAARAAGLRRRHAQKLARNRAAPDHQAAEPQYTHDELRQAADQARIPRSIPDEQLAHYIRLVNDDDPGPTAA